MKANYVARLRGVEGAAPYRDAKLRAGDGTYEELPTGHNIEDLGIHAELRKIGVDLKAWEAEEIHVDEKTGEVTFK